MSDDVTASQDKIPPEKLVRVYLKIKAVHDKVKKDSEAEIEKLKGEMDAVKIALLDYCKEQNVESVRTTAGLFYRSVKTRYWTNDWGMMGKFIVEHGVPELLEKRLHQGNTEKFLEDNPNLMPPGLNVDREYTITVRKE